jgi:hypothetical protein
MHIDVTFESEWFPGNGKPCDICGEIMLTDSFRLIAFVGGLRMAHWSKWICSQCMRFFKDD